jgi:hypothetical protein
MNPYLDRQMVREFRWLVAIWIVCGLVCIASCFIGCTPKDPRHPYPRDPYAFDCKIKWCQPEPKR